MAENDGGNRADLMLEDWAAAAFGSMINNEPSEPLVSALVSAADTSESDGQP